ncbi:hypothetical protein [Agromyces bauzanensis]
MAIATVFPVTYACGHSEERDLSDLPAGQRAGRAAWLAKQKCFECFKKAGKRKVSKEVASERAALLSEAEADQERGGLPVLRGSAKQKDWALTVRFQLLRDAYELVQSGQLDEPGFEEQILVPARRIDAAHWWIDNRDANVEDLAELLADSGLGAELVSNENPY